MKDQHPCEDEEGDQQHDLEKIDDPVCNCRCKRCGEKLIVEWIEIRVNPTIHGVIWEGE